MAVLDPRVDAYLAKAPEFARPVLVELRARVHAAVPGVVETIKWRLPSFEYHGLLGGMGAFQKYCMFGFWKDALLRQEPGLAAVLDACGRMTSLADLPARSAFAKAVRKAAQRNAAGVVMPRAKPRPKRTIAPHPEFARALAAHAAARAQFAAFAPSHRREYLEWIAEAKRDDTRTRRIEQAIEWIAAGKHRNWKYERR